MSVARGAARFVWLIGSATAIGVGIWSMHYVCMLAFRLPVPVEYDWPTVLLSLSLSLSLLTGILSSALALFVVSLQSMRWVRALTASVFMGGGIAALHYTSMVAMRLKGICIILR